MSQVRCLLLVLTLVSASASASTPESVKQEIGILISTVESSTCRFRRNGIEYDAAKAGAHFRGKYAVVSAGAVFETTEAFIEKVATRSSVTGTPYDVRCAGQERIPLASWLRAALARSRGIRDPRDTREPR